MPQITVTISEAQARAMLTSYYAGNSTDTYDNKTEMYAAARAAHALREALGLEYDDTLPQPPPKKRNTDRAKRERYKG